MTIVNMPGLGLGATKKTKVPIDSEYIDRAIAENDENILFQNFWLLCENGGYIRQENDENLDREDCPYEAVYREQPTPRGRLTIRNKYYVPTNPQTPDQQAWRAVFALAVEAWQALTFTEQVVYNKKRWPENMSGYNRFLKEFLQTD